MEIGHGTSKLTNSKNIEEEINANGNQAILLENRLGGNFVSKNTVETLMMQRFLYCRKDSILFQQATI